MKVIQWIIESWIIIENTLSFIDNIKRFLNNCESYKEYTKFSVLIVEGKSSQRIGFEDPFDFPFWKLKESKITT